MPMARSDLAVVQEIAKRRVSENPSRPQSAFCLLREGSRYSLLSAEEELALIEIVRKAEKAERQTWSLAEAGRQAIELLVLCNLRLVYRVVRSFSPPPDMWEDLVQEGTIGLLKAIRGFDTTHGCKFSTYAFFWVRLFVSRAYDAERGTSAHRRRVAARLSHEWEQFVQKWGRLPTEHEMEEAHKQLGSCYPEQPKIIGFYTADDDSLEDIISGSENVERECDYLMLGDAIEDVMRSLDPTAAFVLCAKYGIGRPPMKAREIASVLGVPVKTVWGIEKSAIRKLRHPRNLRRLRGFF